MSIEDLEYIATFDPPTVLEMLSELERLRAECAMLTEGNFDRTAERDHHRKTLRLIHRLVSDREHIAMMGVSAFAHVERFLRSREPWLFDDAELTHSATTTPTTKASK